ncbi:hypothetical protein SAMN05878276_2143 [Aquipseudomonas alcaligenes]|nr:hypothetical protein SAMN05878276_2143 [Pseudomonas alcaligenes]
MNAPFPESRLPAGIQQGAGLFGGYPILAFWALWHCRHARPPDAALIA